MRGNIEIMPKISAVIPLYKSDFYIKGAVESILNQDMDDYEIILVSDGSPGRERKILSEYEGRFRFIEIPHGGIANAWNVGFRAAKGEYFTWFGADDRHFSNSFRIMSKFLDENKDVGMVYADIVIVTGKSELFEKKGRLGWQEIFTRLDKVRENIIERFKGKKIVIYGAGTASKYIYYHIEEELNIQAIVDWNTKLHNTKFEDKIPLYPPEYLKKLDYDYILVTAIDRKTEILNYLKGLLEESELGKILFFEDILKLPVKINTDKPVNLIQYQDLFSKVDQFKYTYSTNEIKCITSRRPEFTAEELLKRNFLSPIFIYRSSVLDIIGEYDPSYEIVMDFDYWLRISENFQIMHIPEVLGIVNANDDSFHIKNRDKTCQELEVLMERALKRRGIDRKWNLINRVFHFDGVNYS